MKIIVFKALPAAAMAVYPFILIKYAADKEDPVLLNHERIHLAQQLAPDRQYLTHRKRFAWLKYLHPDRETL